MSISWFPPAEDISAKSCKYTVGDIPLFAGDRLRCRSPFHGSKIPHDLNVWMSHLECSGSGTSQRNRNAVSQSSEKSGLFEHTKTKLVCLMYRSIN